MTSDYIKYFITAILLILIVLKTFLFFSSTTKRRLENWFFFNNYAMYNSRNDKSRKSKLLQNKLTLLIAGIAIIDVIVFIVFRS